VGILSTSLVLCENSLIRTRSNIIGFVRSVLVQPTDKACCQFFQPCRCLKWSVDNSCKLHCASACSRIAYLEHEGSTVWSSEYVEKAIALHVVVPRFVVIVLERSFSLSFPHSRRSRFLRPDLEPWCDENYSDGFTDNGNICMRRYAPVCTISSDEDWRARKRCKSRVSASSWLPWSIDVHDACQQPN